MTIQSKNQHNSWPRALVDTSLKCALLALLLTACASSTVLDGSVDAAGVPVWVNTGSNILTSAKTGQRFHGVGTASMLGDFSLQTARADTHAKAEVARILASYLEIVSRNFIASGDAEKAGFTEQSVAQQIDSLAEINLSGTQVIGHWQNKQTRVIYAIAELDMEQLQQALKESATLNKGFKEYIDSEGGKIFDRIAKPGN